MGVPQTGAVEPGDAEVVGRVLGGDVDAFGILVTRYRVQFGRYAVAMTGDADTAADAIQEAFIRAWRSLASCEDPARFGSWFFRILTNQCHDARKRRRPADDVGALDLAAKDRADAQLERSELADALDRAMEQLTSEQREAFVLKHVDGRSYEEMAALLGTGVDALKMRVYRARETLRALMGGRGDG